MGVLLKKKNHCNVIFIESSAMPTTATAMEKRVVLKDAPTFISSALSATATDKKRITKRIQQFHF